MILPPRLHRGSRIAVVSPASAARPELVERGTAALRALFGYEPVMMPSALARGPLYYAGDAQARAADLHAAFADRSIDAVLCTRGGWGTAELLPLLDAQLIRDHPKPFLGFSDHTTLHLWLQQVCGLITFYAPMLSPDFARCNMAAEGVHVRSWRAALESDEPWSVGAAEGMRVLRGGTAQGPVYGGCLALLTESLGTAYAMQPAAERGILFLEEVATRAYQWDRMLLHLDYAGILQQASAIVLGDMAQCAATPEEAQLIEDAILHRLRDFTGPVAIGLQSGHVDTPNVTLPLGVRGRLVCEEGTARLDLLTSAVA